MSLINQQALAESRIAFQTRFNRALEAIDDPIKGLGMEVPSSHPIEKYNWLDAVPGLTEWIDTRKLSKRSVQETQIVNKSWASGIRMDADDLKDDKLSLLGMQVDELARKAGLFMGERMIDALVGGFGTTSEFGAGYDSVAFFSAAHQDVPTGPTQNNYTAGGLSQATYDAARATMWSLQDSEGDPLGIVPNTLFVGPSNERLAKEITGAAIIPGAAAGETISNVFIGTAQVVVSPRLSGAQAGHWFLADLSRAIRPIVMQVREPITTAMTPASGSDMDYSGSEAMFMQKTMKFGAQMRGNVGYALWQFVHGSDA